MQRIARFGLPPAILAIVLASALPLAAFASRGSGAAHRYHRSHAVATQTGQTVFTFGIQGGNIRPWSVTISDTGAVSSTGSITVRTQSLAEARDTLNGLLKLADAENFFAQPGLTQCSGTLPDVAARWIRIQASGDTKKDAVHGTCNAAFNQIYAVLTASVGASQVVG